MIFNTLATLPQPLQMAVQKELRPGEILAYAAQPHPLKAALPVFLLWGFAIPWCSLTFPFFGIGVWMVYDLFFGAGPQKAEQWASLIVPVFALPFVAVGLGMLGAPFWVMHKAGRTAYAITDRRIFSVTLGRSLKMESCAPDRIQSITRTERTDGSGSLKLVTGHYRDSDGDRNSNHFDLSAIPNVAEANRLIEALMERARQI